MSNVDVLVVAPHAPDLEGLGQTLGCELSANLSGMEVVAKTVGLGLPGVAGGVTQRLIRFHPRAIVLLGTCAAYPGCGIPPGQVVVGERVCVADAAVLRGWSTFPDPMTCQVQSHTGMVGGLTATGTKKVGIASACAVTHDTNLGAEFASHLHCAVEHNEAFGVALACAPFQTPFVAVLGVSHKVGPQSRETWRVTHRSAAKAAATLIGSWLRGGAAGVPHDQTR